MLCAGVEEAVKDWSDQFWEDHITSKNGVPGKDNRIHWFNHCCPGVNHSTWPDAEEEQLVQLVEEHNKRDVSLAFMLCILDCATGTT